MLPYFLAMIVVGAAAAWIAILRHANEVLKNRRAPGAMLLALRGFTNFSLVVALGLIISTTSVTVEAFFSGGALAHPYLWSAGSIALFIYLALLALLWYRFFPAQPRRHVCLEEMIEQ